MISSILLKPYIALEPADLEFIIIVCVINLFFCVYYFREAIKSKKIFSLEDKHIIRFGKRLGVASVFYIPHIFLVISLYFRRLHGLEVMMLTLLFLMELLLLGVVFKEVYDLIFADEEERKFELEYNRKRYIEGKEIPLP